MVYSGLEFGQYFELKGNKKFASNHLKCSVKILKCVDLGEKGCRNPLIALTPATRMVLSIVQMQFIFLNTKEFEMKRHKVIVRFGIMHMLATNLCEWLYVLVEETRHEISNNIENATGKYLEILLKFPPPPLCTTFFIGFLGGIASCCSFYPIFRCEFGSLDASGKCIECIYRSGETCNRI